MVQLASQHPQYAIFGVKASQKTYEQSLKIVTDVSDILASGELNLATAGGPYKILHNISENVKNLKLWLLAIKLRLEKANRLGFWNSINPFAGYISTDKGIVENIMNRSKEIFKYHKMKKIFQILLIPTIYLIITSSSGGSTPAWQQENVSIPMMNIEINATIKEHDRQIAMRQKQTANATIENCQ